MLNINNNTDGAKGVIELEGRLDSVTAPELEDKLIEVMEGAEELEFDFGKLEYISSAGLRVLLKAQKEMSKKGGMKVKNVNEMIMEIFEITGFADILTIE